MDSSPTQLLLAWGRGDAGAFDRLARGYMRRERPDHTLQASALVNEAYVRLIDLKQMQWQNRAHFFAMSARVMRRILVDAARARRQDKRGGGAPRVSFDGDALVAPEKGHDLVALDDALAALAELDQRRHPSPERPLQV